MGDVVNIESRRTDRTLHKKDGEPGKHLRVCITDKEGGAMLAYIVGDREGMCLVPGPEERQEAIAALQEAIDFLQPSASQGAS